MFKSLVGSQNQLNQAVVMMLTVVAPLIGLGIDRKLSHTGEAASTESPVKQLEFFEIPSPCIGVCESGPRGYCKGCYRSREERQFWFQIDDATRRQILDACRTREYRHKLALKNKEPGPSEPPRQTSLLNGE